MGDSDDDYDRRKQARDKFRQERRDFDSGGSGGGRSSRQQASDRSPPPMASGGGGYGGPRRQYHHSSRNDYYYHERGYDGGGGGGPPFKRPRRGDEQSGPGDDGAWGGRSGQGGGGRYNYSRDGGPPPPLMGPNMGGGGGPQQQQMMMQHPQGPPPSIIMQGQHPHHHHGPAGGPSGGGASVPTAASAAVSANVLKTFKQFLLEQDDGITEQEALTRYRTYKEEFVRRQLAEFFDAHKSEEWFKEKYHPDFYEENLHRCRDNVNRRLQAFEKLQSLGLLNGRVVHIDQARELVRFMDSLVILLEGGCPEDFEVLDAADDDDEEDDEEEGETEKPQRRRTPAANSSQQQQQPASSDSAAKKPDIEPAANDDDNQANDAKKKEKKQKKVKRKKRTRRSSSSSSGSSSSSSSSSSNSSSSSSSSDNSDNSDAEDGGNKAKSKSAVKKQAEDEETQGDEAKPPAVSVQGYSASVEAADTPGEEAAGEPSEKEEGGQLKTEPKAEAEDATGEESNKEKAADDTKAASSGAENAAKYKQEASQEGQEKESTKEKEESKKKKKAEDDEQAELRLPRRPRPLHRTQSIFLRNLHPSITRAEVEALCKAYPGFVRLALQDPVAERKFFRRGWITFRHDVSIKEICWNLNNIRLKDCDLGAIVNRELSQRVRPIMTVANHRQVMRQDIRLAARIVQQLDAKHGLHVAGNNGLTAATEDKDKSASTLPTMAQLPSELPVTVVSGASGVSPVVGATSANPLLKNLAEYIVDEGSYEEEALLGGSSMDAQSGGDAEVKIEIDPALQSKLDHLILYLRAVHSVDFYSATEYPSEDDMPHRCGIVHARGAVTMTKPILQREVDNYMREFEAKVQSLTQYVSPIVDSDAKKLGLRDAEAAVEKFIQDNTKELGQDKWLCPLSGKKFKGPEFIRKHIFNKYQPAVDEVRKEAQYFNNYIKDPKRPHVAEPSPQQHQQQQQQQQHMPQQQPPHHHHQQSGHYMMHPPMGGRGGFRGRDFDYGYGGYGGRYNDPQSGRRPDFYGGGGYPPQRDFGGRGGYFNDGRRGGFRGGGGGGEGRPVRLMAPGGRKVINYNDLDAPEDF